MDIRERLQELMNQRGWTMYRLSKEAELPWSTLKNIMRRGTSPSVSTLEIYCRALGVTLSQFFDDGGGTELSEEQGRLLKVWAALDEEDRRAVLSLMERLARRD